MLGAIITAISDLLADVFKFKTAKIENISSVEIVKDKKDYKQAVNIAEKIIAIADCYKTEMTFFHRLKFCHLVDNFKKYN